MSELDENINKAAEWLNNLDHSDPRLEIGFEKFRNLIKQQAKIYKEDDGHLYKNGYRGKDVP